AKKHAGTKNLTSDEVRKIFGYKKGYTINGPRSRIYIYIEFQTYKHPKILWKIKNLVALERDEFFKLHHGFISSNMIIKKLKWTSPTTLSRVNLFLIDRKKVPFWKLKEFGGWIE
ncbi:MAG: hypothetical protein PVG65_05250, partial [Candidatus Thorarchaeota archaeon]